MRLLVVEDDAMVGDGLCRGLRQDGFTVDWVEEAEGAELALDTTAYDLIVLDLGLPGRSGMELLSDWRQGGRETPVLILTARDAVNDRVKGLDGGADDYLVKPFDLDELAARIRALLRRRAGRARPVLTHGDVMLDPASHEVTCRGQAVALSPREFAVLSILMDKPGAVLSRATLEERLYGWNEEVESNAVEVHIHHLRRKLGSDFIRTLRGAGYYLTRDA